MNKNLLKLDLGQNDLTIAAADALAWALENNSYGLITPISFVSAAPQLLLTAALVLLMQKTLLAAVAGCRGWLPWLAATV